MERLIKVGKIQAKNAKDIQASRFGLGMEKLDRDELLDALARFYFSELSENNQE